MVRVVMMGVMRLHGWVENSVKENDYDKVTCY